MSNLVFERLHFTNPVSPPWPISIITSKWGNQAFRLNGINLNRNPKRPRVPQQFGMSGSVRYVAMTHALKILSGSQFRSSLRALTWSSVSSKDISLRFTPWQRVIYKPLQSMFVVDVRGLRDCDVCLSPIKIDIFNKRCPREDSIDFQSHFLHSSVNWGVHLDLDSNSIVVYVLLNLRIYCQCTVWPLFG